MRRKPVAGRHERFTTRSPDHNYRSIQAWKVALRREKAAKRARKRSRGTTK